MFDIGFSELVLIAVVALVVIGPEKLPKTARTMGHLYGRLQRYIRDVKTDITREMELEELRKLKEQVQSAARDIETSVSSAAREVESGVRAVEANLGATAAAAADPPAGATPAPAAATPAPAPAVAAPAPAPGEASRQKALPGFDQI
jgi:sec-independent protein translocase protein TatB